MTVEEIIQAIDVLTVGQMRELTHQLQERYDVVPATEEIVPLMPVASEVEQYEFDVFLIGVGPVEKIATIKAVREVTKLGIREAKEAVEAAPIAVATAVTREIAEHMRTVLAAAGATVEIR